MSISEHIKEHVILGIRKLWGKIGNDIYYNKGNVGIGTSSPTSANGWSQVLQIEGVSHGALTLNEKGQTLIDLASRDGDFEIWTGTRRSMLIDVAGDTSVVETAGNFGVGIATPGAKLDVQGTAIITGALTGGGTGHDQFSDFVANEHIDWTSSSAGTIHATNYVDNDTTDHTALSNIGTNTHAQIDTHMALTNEHIDWTADQGATNIDSGNYTDTNTQLTTEQVQDIAGPLSATGGTKTNISVTYQDGTNDMDFDVVLTTGTNVTGDHGTAATDEIVNICYGTGTAPTASTTTEGALFVKYTA